MSGPFSRREFLRISGLSGALAALAACNPLGATPESSTSLPTGSTALPTALPVRDEADLVLHTLRRTTFGPTAQELTDARRIGLEGWIETQLNPAALDHGEVEQRLADFDTLKLSPAELLGLDQKGLIAASSLRPRLPDRSSARPSYTKGWSISGPTTSTSTPSPNRCSS